MKISRFMSILLMIILIMPGNEVVYATPDIVSSDLLWLVNQDNPLDAEYEPAYFATREGYKLHPDVSAAYGLMISALRESGINNLRIQSAYRTYTHQQQIFRNKKTILLGLGYDEEEAIEMTSQSIAFPGASEHQTGLALDVTQDGTLNRSFADTEAGRWIGDHCHEYGFIVRYTEEKKPITRIIYEPWHLRYVGLPHSAFMKEKNLCFEEYIDYLIKNEMYIYWNDDNTYYLVMYAKEPDIQSLHGVIDISADRFGPDAGYIITMRKTSPRIWAGMEKPFKAYD